MIFHHGASKMNSTPSRYLHYANLAASCEHKAKHLWLDRRESKLNPADLKRDQKRLWKLAAVYRAMAVAEAPASAFADDCAFEVGGTLAESHSLQQASETPLSEEQEGLPLSGGYGEKPPRRTELPPRRRDD
jgi:hypothetical protein